MTKMVQSRVVKFNGKLSAAEMKLALSGKELRPELAIMLPFHKVYPPMRTRPGHPAANPAGFESAFRKQGMPLPLILNLQNAIRALPNPCFVKAQECGQCGPINSAHGRVFWHYAAHSISRGRFDQVVMLKTLDRQYTVETRPPPTALAQLTGETQPTTIHVKVTTPAHPLAQKIEPVRKDERFVSPLGALEKIRMQHQALRFDIREDYGRGPIDPFIKIFRRHVVELPGRLRDYVSIWDVS